MAENFRVEGQRLGRTPTPPDIRRRNFKLAQLMRRLPEPPATFDLSPGIPQWPMYANDRLGDCTCAAIGHMLEVWTQQVDGQARLLPDAAIVALYNRVNGGVDEGANMQDVLNVMRHEGLAGDTLLAYAEVNAADQRAVATACWLFGGVYFGANLALANQSQATWDAVEGPDGEPGSWGGHAINLVQYDDAGGTLITWGALKRFTWAWWHKYVDEAYAGIPQDYDKLVGRPLANGFDEKQLLDDLASLPHPR